MHKDLLLGTKGVNLNCIETKWSNIHVLGDHPFNLKEGWGGWQWFLVGIYFVSDMDRKNIF